MFNDKCLGILQYTYQIFSTLVHIYVGVLILISLAEGKSFVNKDGTISRHF
jgi:hypothetical protein